MPAKQRLGDWQSHVAESEARNEQVREARELEIGADLRQTCKSEGP